jgi:hypothetical protein
MPPAGPSRAFFFGSHFGGRFTGRRDCTVRAVSFDDRRGVALYGEPFVARFDIRIGASILLSK